ENLRDRHAPGAELPISKCSFHERPGVLGPQLLFADDLLQFSVTPSSDEGAPLLIDSSIGRDSVDEVLDQVAFVAERRAGIDCPRDLVADLLVVTLTVLVTVLLDQHEDVVDVDL